MLMYYCRFAWDSGSIFKEEHSTPSHVSLHIKDQNTAWGSISAVSQGRTCCMNPLVQGATVPLITRLQTPSSNLHVSSTRHNVHAPVPRAGEASQVMVFALTAAGLTQHWGSCYWLHRKCHLTSPMHHPTNTVCNQPHSTTVHYNPSVKSPCFK